MIVRLRVIVKDTLSEYLNFVIDSIPYGLKYISYDVTKTIERVTHDYVPRNADPPRDRGRSASGTLQSGFFFDVVGNGFYSKSIFGYVAYDTYKDQMYAERVHTHPQWVHPPRYPGHKPQYNFLSYSLRAHNGLIMDKIMDKYMELLTYR